MAQARADYVLLSYFGVWLLFGLLVLSSAGVAVGLDVFQDPYFFIRRQLLYGVLPGIVLFWICARIPYTIWQKYASLIFIGSLLLLMMVWIPGIGTSFDKHAQSWLTLGGFSFQPAEVAKLALIIFLSYYLTRKGTGITSWEAGFVPTLVVAGVPVLLILLQPDLGTSLIFLGIIVSMLYVAGARLAHLGGLLAVGAVGVLLMAFVSPYRFDRLMTFMHPELDPLGIGYQINQGFLAIGSGGWLGLGLGHSRQKFQYLPEVQADSIFAVAAEELGFVVVAGLIVLLVLIFRRGLQVARAVPDQFARLVAVGIVSWFMIQAFLNIGAMVGLLPLTGVPLPFISHGGSALLIALAAVGVLTNISKYRSE